ncbi:hypothetical protein GCM10023176_55740 [Micromonospora coerulea]|uniref:Uncharacterized protein n=1 Tax=Micromonospora coerulea TaxID=47856 RepID=A0ABP8T044_9ACTN
MLRGHLRYPCKDLLVVMEPVPSYEDLIWLFEAEPVSDLLDHLLWAGQGAPISGHGGGYPAGPSQTRGPLVPAGW